MTTGYTTIQIGDKPVGIKFAFLAIKLFTEASVNKLDIYFTDKSFTVFGLSKLLESGYKNNCELKETPYEISFEQFHDWVELQNETGEGQKELVRVLEVYASSKYSKKFADDLEKKRTDLTATV